MEDFELNELLLIELAISKEIGEMSRNLKDLFVMLVNDISSKQIYESNRVKHLCEINAYLTCRKYYPKYNLYKRPKPLLYFKVLIRGSFSGTLLKIKRESERNISKT